MTAHDPKPRRDPSRTMGAHSAACPCGWRASANGGDEARQRAAEHAVVVAAHFAAEHMVCECYDPLTMEYRPEPCDRCRLREALEVVA